MTPAQALRAIGAAALGASVPLTVAQPIVAGALGLLGQLASVAADGLDQGITDAELVAQLKRAKRIDTSAADAAADVKIDAKPSRA